MTKKQTTSKGNRNVREDAHSNLVKSTWSGELKIKIKNNGGLFSLDWLGRSFHIESLDVGPITPSSAPVRTVLVLTLIQEPQAFQKRPSTLTQGEFKMDACYALVDESLCKGRGWAKLRTLTLPAVINDRITV